ALFNKRIHRLIENDHLIVVEFYDATSNKITEVIKPSALQVEAELPKHGSDFSNKDTIFTQKVSLNNDTYLRVFIPIFTQADAKIGYMEGIYHAPAEIIHQIKQQTFWSLLLVVLVV